MSLWAFFPQLKNEWVKQYLPHRNNKLVTVKHFTKESVPGTLELSLLLSVYTLIIKHMQSAEV